MEDNADSLCIGSDAKLKLAIVGSRHFNDYEWMERCLRSFIDAADIECIISGGAKGADELAERFAAVHGIPLAVFPAEWKKYGKRAGPVRNAEIVQQADMIAAFWNCLSSGTRDTVTKARKAGKPVKIFPCEEVSPCRSGASALHSGEHAPLF